MNTTLNLHVWWYLVTCELVNANFVTRSWYHQTSEGATADCMLGNSRGRMGGEALSFKAAGLFSGQSHNY